MSITYKGEELSIREASRKYGVPRKTLSRRINEHGWSVEKAIETPAYGNKTGVSNMKTRHYVFRITCGERIVYGTRRLKSAKPLTKDTFMIRVNKDDFPLSREGDIVCDHLEYFDTKEEAEAARAAIDPETPEEREARIKEQRKRTSRKTEISRHADRTVSDLEELERKAREWDEFLDGAYKRAKAMPRMSIEEMARALQGYSADKETGDLVDRLCKEGS